MRVLFLFNRNLVLFKKSQILTMLLQIKLIVYTKKQYLDFKMIFVFGLLT